MCSAPFAPVSHFYMGGETCIMIYTLLGCFPIRNKERAQQVRKLMDGPPRYKTTHVRQCLFSVWQKFSSCSVLSTLANQKGTRFMRYKADQQCQQWQNGPILSRRESCLWSSTVTVPVLLTGGLGLPQHTDHTPCTYRSSVPFQVQKSVPASRQLFIQLMSVCLH